MNSDWVAWVWAWACVALGWRLGGVWVAVGWCLGGDLVWAMVRGLFNCIVGVGFGLGHT